MVWVPTSKTWTMWGGFFCRYAAMAPVRTSGYVPLLRALTSYSDWLWLNCFTSSFVAAPSCPPIACQKWISVFACAGVPMRSTATATASAVQRLENASMSRLLASMIPRDRQRDCHRYGTIARLPARPPPRSLLLPARAAAHEAPLEREQHQERLHHRRHHARHDEVPLRLGVGRHEHLDADLDDPHLVRRRDDERPQILVPHVQELHEEQRRQVVDRQREQDAHQEAQGPRAVHARRLRQGRRDRQEELAEEQRAGGAGEEGHGQRLVGVHPAEVVHELEGRHDPHRQRQ